MSAIDSLPPSLRRYLREFALRRIRQRLIRRLGLALLVFMAAGTVACLADRLLALSGPSRLILLLICCCLGFAVIAPALRAWLQRSIDWNQTALSVERRHPTCGERLVTVISRLLGPDRDRGSGEMVGSIASELVEDVRAYPIQELLPVRRLAPPWITLAVFLTAFSALWTIPQLDMPRLLSRFVQPFDPVRPATTTHLLITPGDTDLVETQPLQIQVHTKRLGDSPVVLHLRRQGSNWYTMTMSFDAAGVYTCSLEQADQDMEYFVTGGDAISDVYRVRVLRKPAVTTYEIHYDYPSTTALPAVTVWNSDGLIKAPAGTLATLRIHCSEPLSAATLTVGPQALAMSATDDPTVRQATITVTKNQGYELGLSSTRGMVGAGATKLAIKVIPDHAPSVQLLSPIKDQWLQPAAMLPLIYDARDDFALGTLEVRVHIVSQGRASEPDESEDPDPHKLEQDLPLRIVGDQRRQVGECRLDLGALRLSVGDIATLHLRAVDRRGQSGLSEAIHLVLAPCTVSHRQRELPKALTSASELLRKWIDTQDANDKDGFAEQLRSAVLRAVFECGTAEDASGLGRLADAVEQVLPTPSRASTSDAAKLIADFTSLAQAAEARNLLLDLTNLSAIKAKAGSAQVLALEAGQRSVETLQKQVEMQLTALHLDPKAPDTQQLQRLADRWNHLDRSEINFSEAAYSWFDGLLHGRGWGILAARLDTAAKVETVRPDGDLLWARDLERASIAAATFHDLKPTDGPPPAAARLPIVLAVLQREHRIWQTDQTALSQRSESDEVIRARQQLAEWSSDIPESAQTPAGQLEALTLHASAETVLRNLSNTLAIDRALAREVTPAAERSARSEFATAEAAREMDLVQALDALVLRQQTISDQLERAASISSSIGMLPDQQAKLAESLTRAVKSAGTSR